jgi:hypothetical protein
MGAKPFGLYQKNCCNKMKVVTVIGLILFCNFQTRAQYKNTVWVFGDSCLIDFSLPFQPTLGTSYNNARGACCSVSDNFGLLILSAHTEHDHIGIEEWGCVRNKYHEIIENGDSLAGSSWYQEIVLVPKGFALNKFFMFTTGVTSSDKGLWYSEINMNANNDSGKVIKKNKALHYKVEVEGINAIKHGNGKDWWLLTRRDDPTGTVGLNFWDIYLITDSGIVDSLTLNVGTLNLAGFCKTAVSQDGKKIAFANNMDLVEIFDFDRCTGIISNPKVAQFQIPFGGDAFFGVEFSPNGNVLYTSELGNSKIFQYDLTAPNILQTRTMIYHDTSSTGLPFGGLKLAPDGHIYFTRWGCTHLGVIYNPDTLGLGCNFYPDTFYLGGHISNMSLPNNPNYELGPDSGSVCDTLGLNIAPLSHAEGLGVRIFPNPTTGTFTIVYTHRYAGSITCKIFDLPGNIVYQNTFSNATNNQTIKLNNVPSGMYLIKVFDTGGVIGRAKLVVQ